MAGLTVIVVLAGILIFGAVLPAEETGTEKDKSERGIVAALAYPGLTIGPEDKIRVDLIVKNKGRSDETVFLDVVEKPEGWKAQIKSFGDIVSGVFVAEDEDKTLTFTAEEEDEDKKLTPGKYGFVVKARTTDGALTQTTSIEVTVVEKEKAEEAIELTSSYPVLRGPSDAKFEFSLDVKNDSDEDALFNLQATAPEGWEVSFKPAYEQKQISSLQIKANQSKSVGIEVTSARKAGAGEYPIKVRVQSSKAEAEVEMMVVLTGTYEIKCGTLNGLLSIATQTGQKASMSLYVRNEGSAPQKEISFVSFKPENWEVEFEPEKIEDLKPGELKQVEITIVPAGEALVGDYSVAVSAQGEKSTDEVELRVTVRASSTWGWIGIGIIVLVIVTLAIIFRRLGRR
jgi:uncharacterized membrane protein